MGRRCRFFPWSGASPCCARSPSAFMASAPQDDPPDGFSAAELFAQGAFRTPSLLAHAACLATLLTRVAARRCRRVIHV